MTLRFFITILIFAFLLTSPFTSCDEPQNANNVQPIKGGQRIQPDTLKTAILPFDQKNDYIFDNSYKPATLTKEDIHNIDSLLIACVTDYNNSLDKNDKRYSIDLKKYDYRKQIIAAKNRKGDKVVWVHCLCTTLGSDKWQTEIMQVEDGGNCFFQFKINLSTKKFYDLQTNGSA